MRASTSILCLSVLIAGCGRSQVGLLSSPSRSAGTDAATGGSADAGGGLPDAGPIGVDVAQPPMDECSVPDDCFASHGEPICDNGQRGQWSCERVIGCLALPCPARCIARCEPPPPCRSDCQCPSALSCVGGMCQASGRRNLCCDNPDCPAGAFCQELNGRPGRCPEGPDTCVNDCDCPFDLSCVNGACMPINRPNQCCDNPACPSGARCVTPDGDESICLPMMTGQTGAACRNDAACGPDSFCILEQDGFWDGYCSNECRSERDCNGDAQCRQVGRDSVCFDGCNGNNDCRNGYRCIRLGGQGDRICWPVEEGSRNPNGAAVGSGCSDDNQCATGLTCLETQGGEFPGGYCTRTYCDSQTNPCPQGSVCRGFGGNFSMCLQPCPNPGGGQSTCRQGYRCLGQPNSPEGVCIGN